MNASPPQNPQMAMSEPKDSASPSLTSLNKQGNADPGKKPGRPKKTLDQPRRKTIEVALEVHLFDALEKRRNTDGVTRTRFVSSAIFSALNGARRPAQESAVAQVARDMTRIIQLVAGAEKLIFSAKNADGEPALGRAAEIVRTFVVESWARELSRARQQLALHLDVLRARNSAKKGGE